MRRSLNVGKLEDEIARLRDLDLSELRDKWRKHYKTEPSKSFRRDFLVRAIAYQMQVEVYGGLKSSTLRKLKKIAEALREGKPEAIFTAPRIKPGTLLVRSWRDETHIVTALEEGFEWKSNRYKSLSEVARAITGTQWNGLVFFGVKPRSLGNKNAQKRRAGNV